MDIFHLISKICGEYKDSKIPTQGFFASRLAEDQTSTKLDLKERCQGQILHFFLVFIATETSFSFFLLLFPKFSVFLLHQLIAATGNS